MSQGDETPPKRAKTMQHTLIFVLDDRGDIEERAAWYIISDEGLTATERYLLDRWKRGGEYCYKSSKEHDVRKLPPLPERDEGDESDDDDQDEDKQEEWLIRMVRNIEDLITGRSPRAKAHDVSELPQLHFHQVIQLTYLNPE